MHHIYDDIVDIIQNKLSTVCMPLAMIAISGRFPCYQRYYYGKLPSIASMNSSNFSFCFWCVGGLEHLQQMEEKQREKGISPFSRKTIKRQSKLRFPKTTTTTDDAKIYPVQILNPPKKK